MKDIEIPNRTSLKFSLELKAGQSTTVFSNDDFELLKKIRQRMQKILQSCLDIETYIKELISELLFKDLDDRDFLTGLLLENNSCTFMTKRRLLISCLAHFNLLKPEEREKLDKELSKIIKYRNAFAHGNIKTIPPFYIEHFDGSKQKKELTEEYWTTLAKHLKNTFSLLEKIEKTINPTG